MKILKINIKGHFGIKKQRCIIFQGIKKEGIFIIHGLYGTGLKKKYLKIAQFLNKEGYYVFLFESSRLQGFREDLNYEEKMKFFINKKFKDEVLDVKESFKKFIKLTHIKKINIVGFSLGGTISSFLIKDFYSVIKRIFLFGSGISTKNKNRPIVNSYPTKKEILANFNKFKGKLFLIQGTKDNIVPLNEARQIILKSNNSLLRKLIILKGVDHQFKYIKNKDKENVLTKLIVEIIIKELKTKEFLAT